MKPWAGSTHYRRVLVETSLSTGLSILWACLSVCPFGDQWSPRQPTTMSSFSINSGDAPCQYILHIWQDSHEHWHIRLLAVHHFHTRGSCYVMTLNSDGNVEQVRCWINVWSSRFFFSFNYLKCQTAQFIAFNGWPNPKAITFRGTHGVLWTSIRSNTTTAQAVSVLYHAGKFFLLFEEWKTEKRQ